MPIPRGNWQETVLPKAQEIHARLAAAGVRVHARRARRVHARAGSSPSGSCAACRCGSRSGRRTSRSSRSCSRGATRARRCRCRWTASSPRVGELLDEIQQALFDRALRFREEHTSSADRYDEFKQLMEGRPGFVIAPWCGSDDCEAADQGRDAGDDPQHAVRGRRRRCVHQVRPAGDHTGAVCEGVLVPWNRDGLHKSRSACRLAARRRDVSREGTAADAPTV